MNRREALTTIGAVAICPTAAMGISKEIIPENKIKIIFKDKKFQIEFLLAKALKIVKRKYPTRLKNRGIMRILFRQLVTRRFDNLDTNDRIYAFNRIENLLDTYCD